MTREDAILCIKGIKSFGRDMFTKLSNSDWQESLDMAIKALRDEDRAGQALEHYPDEVLDRVLEIINTLPNDNPSYWHKVDLIDRQAIRDEVLALKGDKYE